MPKIKGPEDVVQAIESTKFSINQVIRNNGVIDHNGRQYRVLGKLEQHELKWQFLQGLKAFALTILTLCIGLFYARLRELWQEAWTGKERVYSLGILENSDTQKTGNLGQSHFNNEENSGKSITEDQDQENLNDK